MTIIDTNALKRRLARAVLKFVRFIAKYDGSASTPSTGDSTAIPDTDNKPEAPETPNSDPKPLSYVSFGAPNCAHAKEDPNTQIKDFKWSKKGMSYKWAKGDLSNWGIKNKHDAAALAVGGYLDGSTWRFAKFDWISTDRLTRDHNNIEGHYNGFPSAYFKASKHGFFIMSADGKHRTNILTA